MKDKNKKNKDEHKVFGVTLDPGGLTYLTCMSETLRHPRHFAARILRESAA